MHVSSVYVLRQALGLDAPGTPVKVVEPYQMLGEIQPDLMDALGVDVIGLGSTKTLFGFENVGWKPWTTFDGTPVLVPKGFNTVSTGSLASAARTLPGLHIKQKHSPVSRAPITTPRNFMPGSSIQLGW